MNNWIKPSELPPKFHGHCWIVWKGWVSTAVREPYQAVVQNYYRGTAPDEWLEGGGWSYLSDDKSMWVLVYADGAVNCMAYSGGGQWKDWTNAQCHNIFIEEITPWMPLPKSPV